MAKELISAGLLLRKLRQERSEQQESFFTENTPDTGEFRATKEEILQVMMSQHEAKIEGLARHVLKMKTKTQRRKWLEEFELKNGPELTYELKDRILELAKEERDLSLTPPDQSR
jgi:hypothetical protein